MAIESQIISLYDRKRPRKWNLIGRCVPLPKMLSRSLAQLSSVWEYHLNLQLQPQPPVGPWASALAPELSPPHAMKPPPLPIASLFASHFCSSECSAHPAKICRHVTKIKPSLVNREFGQSFQNILMQAWTLKDQSTWLFKSISKSLTYFTWHILCFANF